MGKPRKDIILAIALLAITAGALCFRLPALALRPMHGDEANQAVKTGILLERGEYRYDPQEHHGPTLYYFAQVPLRLAGVHRFADSDEWQYRIVPVVFGTALILLLWIVRRGLGATATLSAAVLAAVSPAMVFYSRYYIQEMLLVFFTFAAIACAWRCFTTEPGERRRLPWLIATGIALGLMHATKETAVLAWAAMAAALLITAAIHGYRPFSPESKTRNPRWTVSILVLFVSFAAASMLFFSSFLTHPRGILDSVLTYTAYAHRAGGAGLHDQPWYTYLALFAYTKRPFGPRWSEGLILGLALIGAIAAFASPGRADKRLLRFLTFYTIILTVLYAVIPYKTPWSALSFFHGMILLAGVGAAALLRWARYWPVQAAAGVILALATWQLGTQAYRASYEMPADWRNPYVYAHPGPDVLRLAERVEALAQADPQGHGLTVKVVMPGGDYWPLPWYLRKFTRVGYWDAVPADPDADLIITARDFQPKFDAALKNDYHVDMFGLRPDVLLVVYTRASLWDAFMSTRR